MFNIVSRPFAYFVLVNVESHGFTESTSHTGMPYIRMNLELILKIIPLTAVKGQKQSPIMHIYDMHMQSTHTCNLGFQLKKPPSKASLRNSSIHVRTLGSNPQWWLKVVRRLKTVLGLGATSSGVQSVYVCVLCFGGGPPSVLSISFLVGQHPADLGLA